MQIGNRQIIRNQATAEIHGKHKHEHEGLPGQEILLSQHIGAQHGHEGSQQSTDNHIKQGVGITRPDVGIVEHNFISPAGKAFGDKKQSPVIHQQGGVTDGTHNNVYHGVKAQ